MNTVESLSEYIISSHKNDLLNIMKSNDKYEHFPLIINFVKLFEILPDYAQNILVSPSNALMSFEKAIIKSQESLMKVYEIIDLTIKPNVHIRISGLPACPELNRTTFPKNQDVGCFLKITGTVIRTTSIKLLEYRKIYICAKCGYNNEIFVDYKQNFSPVSFERCKNPEKCDCTKFTKSKSINRNDCKDYQEIKLQQHLKNINAGSIPSSIWVTLEDDLVDSCKPGDDVGICGIVMRRWKPRILGKRTYVEIVLHANHVQVCNVRRAITEFDSEARLKFDTFWQKHQKNPLKGRNIILESFCPQICGMYLVKLAIVLILAGGSKSENSNSRSEPHLLLVGDPGTGKSHLLRSASKILPRSVLTTGIGSTAAGLTVSAVMDDGEWQLEAGALVLADGGICCIDEFDSMKKHDRVSILEAMEQQTISVAKAAMVCKLNTKCSILAATNPKLSVDSHKPLCESISIASPLLSRFDLVLILKDECNSYWDQEISKCILSQGDPLEIWSLDTMQVYFDVIRNFEPTLTTDADEILRTYYQYKRCKSQDASRITVRLLDSLIRLSQAHAKLIYHSEVTVTDALAAVYLIETSLDSNALRSNFPVDAIINSVQLVKSLLLNDKIISLLDEEIKLISKSCTNLKNYNKLISLNSSENNVVKETFENNSLNQNSQLNQTEKNRFEKYRYQKSKIKKSNQNETDISVSTDYIKNSTHSLNIPRHNILKIDNREEFPLSEEKNFDGSSKIINQISINVTNRQKSVSVQSNEVNECNINYPQENQRSFSLKGKNGSLKYKKKKDLQSFREKFKFQLEGHDCRELSRNVKCTEKTYKHQITECKEKNIFSTQTSLSQNINIFESQDNIDDIDLNL